MNISHDHLFILALYHIPTIWSSPSTCMLQSLYHIPSTLVDAGEKTCLFHGSIHLQSPSPLDPWRATVPLWVTSLPWRLPQGHGLNHPRDPWPQPARASPQGPPFFPTKSCCSCAKSWWNPHENLWWPIPEMIPTLFAQTLLKTAQPSSKKKIDSTPKKSASQIQNPTWV